MDFLDPKKKRAHKIRLFIGYILVAVAISIGTFILLLETFGYDPYHRSQEVVQNGLVFVENKPQSAKILVNGQSEGQTGKRLVLPEGTYDLSLKRDGYRTWQRQFRLRGRNVEQLTYPLLLPNELEPEEAKSYASAPQLVTQSPDRRWALVLHPGSLTIFDLIDLNDRELATTTITLPQALVNAGQGAHSFEAIDWAGDNRRVLIKHTFQGGVEFLVVDREEPSRSYNVNQTFPVSVTEVELRDRKFDRLHILDSEGMLWLGQADSGQLTTLANRVITFASYGDDTILYATDEKMPADHAMIKVRDGEDTYNLRELPTRQNIVLNVGRYENRWYMAVGAASDQRAYIYRNPRDDLGNQSRLPAPITVLRLNGVVTTVTASPNSRFMGAQSGGEFSVYDAEHDRQYRFDTELELTEHQKAVWMDGFRYVLVSGGLTVMVDFDGSNRQVLVPSQDGFLPMFARNNQLLFTLSQSTEKPETSILTRTSLLSPADR